MENEKKIAKDTKLDENGNSKKERKMLYRETRGERKKNR